MQEVKTPKVPMVPITEVQDCLREINSLRRDLETAHQDLHAARKRVTILERLLAEADKCE